MGVGIGANLGFRFRLGNCETKRRSCPRLRFYPDLSSQFFYNLLADRQTDTRAGNLVSMQTREETENTMMVLGWDADAIVVDFNDPVRSRPFGADANFDRCFTSILHRVTDQVLKNSDHIGFVTSHCRQRPDRYGSPTGSKGLAQILHCLLGGLFQFHPIR